MSLIVETGAGVAGADSYPSLDEIKAYWLARPHDPLAAIVAGAMDTQIEGGARESSAFLDAEWGDQYRGVRRGYVQGLLWPRTGAKDDAGYPLPDRPECIVRAACELTPRAMTARLVADAVRGGAVKRTKEQVGPLVEEVEYRDDAPRLTEYGFVAGMLKPILQSKHWNFD